MVKNCGVVIDHTFNYQRIKIYATNARWYLTITIHQVRDCC